jgi:tetratricopeptide (TPR) repeat protein
MIAKYQSHLAGLACLVVFTAGCGNVSESLSPDYHEKKALSAVEQGDYPKAEEELKLAISLAARSTGPKAGPVGRMNTELADLYKRQDKKEDADEAYRRALVVFSEKPEILSDEDRKAWVACLTHYAELLRATGREDEARVRESQAQSVLEKMGEAGAQPGSPASPPAATQSTEPAGKAPAAQPPAEEGAGTPQEKPAAPAK